ncbi:MAG: ATP synthase F1 subunit gamma [Candidatus Dojkabacteria bacterium]|nr:MAG: ATP synthase F1 subunit gamma [Candidatus Dojkabacteria bacterium]
MANTLRDIKKRIVSVKNTKKVTKSMEMIAAVKMQRVVKQVEHTRKYAEMAEKMVSECITCDTEHVLTNVPDTSRELWVIISSNRGLCGNFNLSVYKTVLALTQETADLSQVSVLALGKKSAQIARTLKLPVLALYDGFSDTPTLESVFPVYKQILDEFSGGSFSKVVLVSTEFYTATQQKVVIKSLLPMRVTEKEQTSSSPDEKTFEPTKNRLLDYLLPTQLQATLYRSVLESAASEHSSRMIAMKNSTDAAGEIINSLQLAYNKSRQAAITQEVAEIVGGMEVLVN